MSEAARDAAPPLDASDALEPGNRMDEALSELEGSAPHMREQIGATRRSAPPPDAFVWRLPIELEVVVGRVRVSVEELVALEPGETLPLDMGETLDLVAGGTVVARARLEEAEGSLSLAVVEVL